MATSAQNQLTDRPDDGLAGQREPAPEETRFESARSALMAESELRACRAALGAGRVTFHDVATAWFRLCDAELPEDTRASFAELYPELLETFAAPRGGIVTAYLCRHIRVAAVLTDAQKAAENPDRLAVHDEPGARAASASQAARGNGQSGRRFALRPPDASSSAIHIEPIFGDPEDWKAKEILFSCLELHHRALEFLAP